MLMAQTQSCFNCHMFYKEYSNIYVLGQQNTQQLRIYNFFNFICRELSHTQLNASIKLLTTLIYFWNHTRLKFQLYK